MRIIHNGTDRTSLCCELLRTSCQLNDKSLGVGFDRNCCRKSMSFAQVIERVPGNIMIVHIGKSIIVLMAES